MPDDEFFINFLTQYYVAQFEQAAQLLPNEILLPQEMETMREQVVILARALGHDEFRIPKRGETVDLVQMVKKTAEFQLAELVRKVSNSTDDLIDTQSKLHLTRFPHRIECYDIPHFQGEGNGRHQESSISMGNRKNLCTAITM